MRQRSLLLLRRPGQGGVVPKKKIQERLTAFAAGQCAELVRESMVSAEQGSEAMRCKRRREGDNLVKRAARAEKLVHLGELSAGRQALEGAEVAPLWTPASLTEDKRPALPREPLPEDIDARVPTSLFDLDWDRFCSNVRTARRGVAGGPSGMTAEHLRPLLENDHDVASLCQFAQIIAWGEVRDLLEPAVRLGRITALQKPDDGVKGIVVGDALRRLVARMAQQIAEEVEKATAPINTLLKTKAGANVSHTSCKLSQMQTARPQLCQLRALALSI